jgi:hypothetical protein
MEKKAVELNKETKRRERRERLLADQYRKATGKPGAWGGGNLILPAYGLNKNLKSLRQSNNGTGRLRARSAKPMRQGRRHVIVEQPE